MARLSNPFENTEDAEDSEDSDVEVEELVKKKKKSAKRSAKPIFSFILHEDLFWEWLQTQSSTNAAVKRFKKYKRKSPMDSLLKLFLKFLLEQGYEIR